MSLAAQVQNLEDKMQEAVGELDQIRATFLVNYGPQGRVEKILAGDERPAFMQIKVLQHLHNRMENIRAAWKEHQQSKFRSDGSHFQADIRLNELLGGGP